MSKYKFNASSTVILRPTRKKRTLYPVRKNVDPEPKETKQKISTSGHESETL